MRIILFILINILSCVAVNAADNNKLPKDKKATGNQFHKYSNTSNILGMSVTGNKESPRSLTIIPWRDPEMNGESAQITPVWQPNLGLLDPVSYRRDIKLFLEHRGVENKKIK